MCSLCLQTVMKLANCLYVYLQKIYNTVVSACFRVLHLVVFCSTPKFIRKSKIAHDHQVNLSDTILNISRDLYRGQRSYERNYDSRNSKNSPFSLQVINVAFPKASI